MAPCCVRRGLLNQYVAAIAGSLTVFTSAATVVWITPTLRHLLGPHSEIPMTDEQSSLVIPVIELGGLLGTLPAGVLINYIGCKPLLLSSVPFYIITWLVILYYRTAVALGVCRIIQGVAISTAFTVAPVYVGEVASNEHRGAITSLQVIFIWAGFSLQLVVGSLLNFVNFAYYNIALNIPVLLLLFWQPESPYYHLMAGNEEKAYRSLKWLRDAPPHKLERELEEIKLSVKERTKSLGLRCLVDTKVDRKALLLLLTVTLTRVGSGMGVLMVYATQIFDLTPNLYLSPDNVTVVLGVVALAGCCVSLLTSDIVGRRPLLLASCFVCLVCHFCLGTYYFLLFNTSLELSSLSWIAPGLIFIYSGLYTLGLYPVCIAYTSELLTSNTRGKASSVACVVYTISNFLQLVGYHFIKQSFGICGIFYLYFVIVSIGTFYCYSFAPETKGKSFVQIRNELAK